MTVKLSTYSIASWQGTAEHDPQFFRNCRIFGNFIVSSENFGTFAVTFGLAPLLYRCHSVSGLASFIPATPPIWDLTVLKCNVCISSLNVEFSQEQTTKEIFKK